MDNYEQLKDILVRAETGGQVTEQEKEVLRQALKGFAPSSDEYRMINNAIGPPAQPYDLSQTQDDGPWSFGLPTLDWMQAGREEPGWNQQTTPGNTVPNNQPPPVKTPDEGPDTITANQPPQTSLPNPISKTPGSPTYGRTIMWGSDDDELPEPEMSLPGYSISNLRPGDVADAYNDPLLMARLIAEDAGQGPASEAQMMPYLEAARALSGMGILGGGTGGDMDFSDIEHDPIGAFQNVEDFMDTFNQPGMQFVDQSSIHQSILERAGNEDWGMHLDQQGQPQGHDYIVEVTNQALMASTPFLVPEAAAHMSSRLQAAGVEYRSLVMRGEIDMTYPDYLKNVLNVDEWFA